MRVHIDEGLRQVLHEARHPAGSRQGVPLIPNAAGIKHERVILVRRVSRGALPYGHEASPAVRVGEATVPEEPCRGRAARVDRPLSRLEAVVLLAVDTSETANIEKATRGRQGRQARMLIEDLARRTVLEPVAITHPPRDLTDHP